MHRAVLASVLFAAACARPDPLVPRKLAPDTRATLREETRALARPACGSCHQRSVEGAKPAALAVFDLDDPDFSRGMSAAELHVFLSRIDGQLDDATRPRVRLFLEGEAARLAVAQPVEEH